LLHGANFPVNPQTFHKSRKEGSDSPEDFSERWQERGETGGDGLALLQVNNKQSENTAQGKALDASLFALQALR
jgi:hypothetical protein